jgi:hypothetical protein
LSWYRQTPPLKWPDCSLVRLVADRITAGRTNRTLWRDAANAASRAANRSTGPSRDANLVFLPNAAGYLWLRDLQHRLLEVTDEQLDQLRLTLEAHEPTDDLCPL